MKHPQLKINDIVEFTFLGSVHTGVIIECYEEPGLYKVQGRDGFKYPRMSFTQSKTSTGTIVRKIEKKDLEK